MWHARVFGGLAVLALGIAVIFFFARQPRTYLDYGPGPGFLPTWIGYVLAGLRCRRRPLKSFGRPSRPGNLLSAVEPAWPLRSC